MEKSPGIKFKSFNTIIPVCSPYLFTGFSNLFENFLFSRTLDFGKRKDGTASAPTLPAAEAAQPVLQHEGSILDINVVSQLSFFIPRTTLFRRLRPLYSGDEDGFSLGSFESKVFNWRAPTILLVRGARLWDDSLHASSGPESTFTASLPPRRFPPGSRDESETLTFGVYVGEPWRHTSRECFGGQECILFQLGPVHDVFRASTLNRDYVSFAKPSSATRHAGVSFGLSLIHI